MTFVVTGSGRDISPIRLEINDFVKDEKFFSLYIQALRSMSRDDQNDIQSFFGVGGIHGLPYVAWNGATGNPPFVPGSGQWGGYCMHGSVLFPTWHRPYVMLFEQILHQRAIEIASSYTFDAQRWMDAACNLRQPFWDWAKNIIPPDEVIALEQVTITDRFGNRVSVDNPLYNYNFHPIDSSFLAPFSNWDTTHRYPTSTDSDATDDVATLKSSLSAEQYNITTSTYNLFSQISTWPAFSNHTVDDGGNTTSSLEGIHDTVHLRVGGSGPAGNMTDPSYAGFDPIFFLHHAQVDRLLSLWAVYNPSVWVTQGPAEGGGSFTTQANDTYDDSTDLTPFWNDQTTFWPSSGLRDTMNLGYTYPDFVGVDNSSPDAAKAAIGNRINDLYGSFVFGSSAAPAKRAAASSIQPNPASAPPDHGVWDWKVRVEVKKFELGSSFSVLIFLGQAPQAENPREWHNSPNYVGGHHAFVNSVASRCGNCRNQQDIVIEGFVHLNHGIVKHSGLGSLEPNEVGPYLTHNLNWKVLKADGKEAELQSLEVTVIAIPLSYPPGAIFPVPGETHRHNRITYGRKGGSRNA